MKRTFSRSTVYRLRRSTGLDVVAAAKVDGYADVKLLVLRDGSWRRLDTYSGYLETEEEMRTRMESHAAEREFNRKLLQRQISQEGKCAYEKYQKAARKQWDEINQRARERRRMMQEPQWQYP